MSQIALHIDRVSKQYRIGQRNQQQSLREAVMHGLLKAFHTLRSPTNRNNAADGDQGLLWALKDVSFEVKRGEVMGLIGRNGAGKSTLLKILSRITEPTTGRVEGYGRVGSLLEVGTGFHPELTGRENIYLNGAVLGMKRVEIDRQFDAIVGFAEVEKFLDTPVKRYSSGMYMRLAFAVAAHLDPEILLVDEVLAVGDAEFQKKCLGKMNEISTQGRTVIFVSHNLGAIQTLCDSIVLFEQGRLVQWGPADGVVERYLAQSDNLGSIPIAERQDRSGQGNVRFRELRIAGADGKPVDFVRTGEDVSLHLGFHLSDHKKEFRAPLDAAILVRDYRGNQVTTFSSFFTASSPTRLGETGELVCHIPRLPLLAGQYRLDLWCAISEETQDLLMDAALLRVEPGNYFANDQDVRLPVAELHGPIVIPQRWAVVD